jgi:ATP-dependent DNA helicase RecG
LKTGKKTGKKTSKKTSEKTFIKFVLTKRQREIVGLLIEDNIRSVLEIAEILNIGVSTVQEHFENLKAKGFIRRMGIDKGGFWEVLINH